MGKETEIRAETYTVAEACKRHKGMKEKQMQLLCLTGELPNARKIGKFWHIPASDLDRYFLNPKKGGVSAPK